jgi:hypothetical protein
MSAKQITKTVGMKGLKQFAHIKQVQQGMEPDDFCNWQK